MNYVDYLNLFGVEAKEIPCIKDSGEPTESTVGAVGLLYMDTDNGNIYKCTSAVDGVYTWVSMSSEAIVAANEYTDSQRLGYTEMGMVDIIPETTPSFEFSDYSGMTEAQVEYSGEVAEGDEIFVVYCGVEYQCAATNVTTNKGDCLVVGNKQYMGGEKTDEPFTVVFDYSATGIATIWAGSGTTYPATIRIFAEVETTVHPIDSKYIPEELPAVDKAITKLKENGQIGKEEKIRDYILGQEVYGSFLLSLDGYRVYHFSDSTFATRLEALEGTETTIIVEWDGVLYERKVLSRDQSCYVGNVSIPTDSTIIDSNGPDTGEPFVIFFNFSSDGDIYIVSNEMDELTHTVACYTETETIHPIDPKYLPGVCLPVIEITSAEYPGGTEIVALSAEEGAQLEAAAGLPAIIKLQRDEYPDLQPIVLLANYYFDNYSSVHIFEGHFSGHRLYFRSTETGWAMGDFAD